jgi:hypothetical protein
MGTKKLALLSHGKACSLDRVGGGGGGGEKKGKRKGVVRNNYILGVGEGNIICVSVCVCVGRFSGFARLSFRQY